MFACTCVRPPKHAFLQQFSFFKRTAWGDFFPPMADFESIKARAHSVLLSYSYKSSIYILESRIIMNKLVLFMLLLLSSVFAPSSTAAISLLPQEAASVLKSCASSAGWYTANTRAGYTDDANSDLQSLNGNIEIFRALMSRDLSSQTVDQIKDMFLSAAWNTANTRAV